MSDPFIGQIKTVGYTFAPLNWSLCDGQSLTISSNQALYSLLGSTYGGNSRTNFNLPDFRGRAPVNYGTSTAFGTLYQQGNSGGSQAHHMSLAEMPSHTHDVKASIDNGTGNAPAFDPHFTSEFAVDTAGHNFYTSPGNLTSLAPDTITNAGAGQSYSLIQPTSVLLFIIAMTGVYPQRN